MSVERADLHVVEGEHPDVDRLRVWEHALEVAKVIDRPFVEIMEGNIKWLTAKIEREQCRK